MGKRGLKVGQLFLEGFFFTLARRFPKPGLREVRYRLQGHLRRFSRPGLPRLPSRVLVLCLPLLRFCLSSVPSSWMWPFDSACTSSLGAWGFLWDTLTWHVTPGGNFPVPASVSTIHTRLRVSQSVSRGWPSPCGLPFFPSLPFRVGGNADHLQEEWSAVGHLGTRAGSPAGGGVSALCRLSDPEIQTLCVSHPSIFKTLC